MTLGSHTWGDSHRQPLERLLTGTADQVSPGRLSATELVRETLRNAILSGDLAGGTKLTLTEVASALQVSTTPVREAMRMLASEGIVDLHPYRGGTVVSIGESEFDEIVRLRRLLEPVAVREAIERMTPEIVTEARRLAAFLESGATSSDWSERHRTFHQTLYRGVRSRRLIAIIDSLRDPTAMFVSSAIVEIDAFRDSVNRQHRDLVEAMSGRDVEKAIDVTLEHAGLSQRYLDSRSEGG